MIEEAALGVNAEAKPAFRLRQGYGGQVGGESPPKRAIQACRNVANDKGVALGCYVSALRAGWNYGRFRQFIWRANGRTAGAYPNAIG